MRRTCRRGPLVTAGVLAGLLTLAGCDADGAGTGPQTGAPTGGATTDQDGVDRTAATRTGGTRELRAGALLTNDDAGALVHLAPGEEVVLRLTPPLQGSVPDAADPQVLEVVPVRHFADPGYAEFELLALAPGRTSITVPAADGTTLLVLVVVQGS